MKKIIVVYGGISSEREVSIATGKEVIKALKAFDHYHVIGYELTADIPSFVDFLKIEKPDAIFNALHGHYGEDGNIQALFNLMKIPYTHSGVKTSAIAMDKVLTNHLYANHGLFVPKNIVMTGHKIIQSLPFQRDVVIKPVSDGSSIGIYIVRKNTTSIGADFKQWSNKLMMVEDYIAGREFTVSVHQGQAIGVTEIQTEHEFYDYKAKYNHGESLHILPAKLSQAESKRIKKYAQKAYNILDCRSVARVDFRYDGKEFYILEINTQPGMTQTSLMPEQMQYIDISYSQLCKQLIETARID